MPTTLDREALLDGALLVRVVARGHRPPLDELPPRTSTPPATVTIDGFELPAQATEAESARGYRLAGRCRHPRRDVRATLDVLVTQSQRLDDPRWWTELRERATRIYDLRMGPVRLVLAEELDVHLAALAP